MVTVEDTGKAATGGPGWGTSLLLLISLFLVLLGIFLPALHVESFLFWKRQHSIWSGIMTFFAADRAELGTALLLVSVVFPLAKIVLAMMTVADFRPGHPLTDGLLATLAILSRWSMTDVFILAVMVLVLDGRLVTTADLRPGAYFFSAGVLLSTGLVYALLMRARRLTPRPSSG